MPIAALGVGIRVVQERARAGRRKLIEGAIDRVRETHPLSVYRTQKT